MKIIASVQKLLNLKFLKSILMMNVIFIIGCYMIGSKVLFYSSFEKDNKPSLQQWEVRDTAVVKFREDVPQNGDKYSLYLEGHWGPPVILKTAVPSIAGLHNYRLTLMGKKDKLNGTAWFGINKDSAFKSSSLQITSASWKKYSLEKTFDSKENDSIYIYLRGGFSELLKGGVYFDMVKLEETD